MEEIKNSEKPKKDRLLPFSIIFSALIIAGAWVYDAGQAGTDYQTKEIASETNEEISSLNILEKETILPVKWNDLGLQMIKAGVIDAEKFESVYAERGSLNTEEKTLLYGSNNGNLVINERNSGVILNLLWAFGLANKNEILEKGPMMTYDGADSPAEALAKAGNFASTGGWTLAQGNTMNHYSRHAFIALTPEQQESVQNVSENIYRPCCNNATHFPDCNHGMAMLGLLELMASQGISEEEMYQVALQVNNYWFPDTYLAVAEYLKLQGISWSEADPKEILGANFSSAAGYRRILTLIKPPEKKNGGSCGV